MDPNLVYLTQTDTTVGFLSQNSEKLAQIKGRDPLLKPFIRVVSAFGLLGRRVPKNHRKFIRDSRATTFVLGRDGEAVRVVRSGAHSEFLSRFGWMYSTSANRAGEKFDEHFARGVADVVVEDGRGFFEGLPSRILLLQKRKIKKLR